MLSIRLWWHKVRHWEYWPTSVVYAFTYMLFLIDVVRFRKLFFFEELNPVMKYGGMFEDSKNDMYALLPKSTYPKTVQISSKNSPELRALVKAHHLEFPLFAKPDKGYRGIGVEIINTEDELLKYQSYSKSDFLLQEKIEFPNELGLFYCRMPGDKKGKILGLTLKKFLNITGDGRSSIQELLLQRKRYALQLKRLKKKIDLTEVIPKGEIRCLEEVGNHNRGTEFIDGSAHITTQLEETFNKLLQSIDGFYWGRLDIRFNTLSELEEGKNFKIIEVNGAKSEPTHIYDKRYSFVEGQKEIFRYYRLFIRVIKQSVRLKTL